MSQHDSAVAVFIWGDRNMRTANSQRAPRQKPGAKLESQIWSSQTICWGLALVDSGWTHVGGGKVPSGSRSWIVPTEAKHAYLL